MIVSIHQPEHLPWLGYFDKARQADVHVTLDHVQFAKNNWQNRNRVRGDRDALWLTVPVLTKGKHSQPIRQVEIDNRNSSRWRDKCWSTMQQHYRKSGYWQTHKPFFEDLYTSDWASLFDMNEVIMGYLYSCLGMETKVLRSSEMKVDGQEA